MAGFFAIFIVISGLAADMPSWLTPYPGAVDKRASSDRLTESFYTAQATPDQVAAHYREIFAAAGFPFQPNSDGIGLSARAATPECDLLLRIREAAGGTSVRVSCAPRAATAAPTAAGEIQVIGKGRAISHSDRVLAEADADSKRRRADMARFDTPVQSGSSPGLDGARKSFYNDDAPPLVWPVWLIQKGADLKPRPVRGTQSHESYLESRYITNLPMTQLHSFYEDLLNANGYKVYSARLSTGQTMTTHMIQNTSGNVEGSQSYDGSVNGPRTTIKVSYRRSVLNGPISVDLRVTVSGSFGRH